MKAITKISFGLFLVVFFFGCTKNFDEINTNPNQPAEVTTATLLTAACKGMCDDIYDEWWGGRQSNLWAQYWVQRNYPTEDRYSIRQNVNNQYWRLIYHDIKNLVQIIKLNTDPDTKAAAAVYGDNNNQIAVATILKVWAMQIMTDTWGDIPYSEAFKADDPTNPIPSPKYDKAAVIYDSLSVELKRAVEMIDVNGSGFTSGDVVYGGDMAKWKKFGNSLRLRVALRLSNTDNYAAAKAIANEPDIEFMTSNGDNAAFEYVGGGSTNSPLYDALWTSARNDFTVAKPFIDILKGADDTLQNPIKVNPFHGLIDPRLQIYSRDRAIGSGNYYGIPYGMNESATQNYWSKGYQGSNAKKAPSFYVYQGVGQYSPVTAPVIFNAKFSPVYMEYAEVEFMLSEINGWDQTHYLNGVQASIEWWRDLSVKFEGRDASWVSDFNAQKDAYLAALPAAGVETVLTQKYLAFYNQAYQAWAEYRRTGYPLMLIKPKQVTNLDADGNPIIFNPLITELTDIPRRLTYPQQEFTVNGANVSEAAKTVGSRGDYMNSVLFWSLPELGHLSK
jgi:hypothetical protein